METSLIWSFQLSKFNWMNKCIWGSSTFHVCSTMNYSLRFTFTNWICLIFHFLSKIEFSLNLCIPTKCLGNDELFMFPLKPTSSYYSSLCRLSSLLEWLWKGKIALKWSKVGGVELCECFVTEVCKVWYRPTFSRIFLFPLSSSSHLVLKETCSEHLTGHFKK